jgi:hypothetical protein
MVRIGHFALIAASCVAASLPVRADDQKPSPVQPAFTPRLNDMMVATQLRHFKLWYAGLVQNWPLANYELTQIRVAIADVKRFYANNGGSNMSAMTQAADDLEDAIKAKDSAKFVTAYAKLTAGCNACHEQTGFGFIKIREPRRRSRPRRSAMSRSPASDFACRFAANRRPFPATLATATKTLEEYGTDKRLAYKAGGRAKVAERRARRGRHAGVSIRGQRLRTRSATYRLE